MATSEAQKRAALKYQKKLGQISIRLPKQELKRYKEAAQKAGIPFRAWVLERLNEGIDAGNLFNDEDWEKIKAYANYLKRKDENKMKEQTYDEAMKVMQSPEATDAEKKKALDTIMGYISWPFYSKALKDLHDSFSH